MNALQIGEPAPSFTLNTLDGAQVSLDDYRGQVVLINFWSAECPWSERTDQVLRERWPKVPVLWVDPNAGESPEQIRQVAAERGLPLVLLDPQQEVADRYGAVTTPQCFLIDAQGVLRYQGAFDDVTFRQRTASRIYVIEALEAVLAGEPAPLAETQPYGCAIVRY